MRSKGEVGRVRSKGEVGRVSGKGEVGRVNGKVGSVGHMHTRKGIYIF